VPACRNSVFLVNDDESRLHHDHKVWLEELDPHAPIAQAGPEAGCGDAHLKRQNMGREVVVAVTDRRLDFGNLERIFRVQAEWLAREFDGRRWNWVLVEIAGRSLLTRYRTHGRTKKTPREGCMFPLDCVKCHVPRQAVRNTRHTS
jgi:thiamine phosphate synthase YjbQ (UPF0047 family)